MSSDRIPCPRCGSIDTGKVSDSPVKGSWVVYGCERCNFVWRSSESLESISKLTDEQRKSAIRI